MATTWVIDSDSHITESPDVWTARVPRKYVDRVPTMRNSRATNGMRAA